MINRISANGDGESLMKIKITTNIKKEVVMRDIKVVSKTRRKKRTP